MDNITVNHATQVGPKPTALSQFQRVANVFYAPSKTFKDIRRGKNSWWLPLILIAIANGIFFSAITVKIGWEQVVENVFRLSSIMSQLPPDQAKISVRQIAPLIELFVLVNPVAILISLALISIVLVGTLNFVFGARAKFKSMLAISMYAILPHMIQLLLGTSVIVFGIAPDSFNLNNFSPTNIGAFLDPMQTNGALYALASSLDVVNIWMLFLLGVGAATVAECKRSFSFVAVYGLWAIAVLVGVGWAAVFG